MDYSCTEVLYQILFFAEVESRVHVGVQRTDQNTFVQTNHGPEIPEDSDLWNGDSSLSDQTEKCGMARKVQDFFTIVMKSCDVSNKRYVCQLIPF